MIAVGLKYFYESPKAGPVDEPDSF
jgi:hypothetical protein